MHDAIRLGIVTHAEMTAQFMGKFYVGTATDDAVMKYMGTLTAVSRPDTVALSNERA
jgi:hypothetical protein